MSASGAAAESRVADCAVERVLELGRVERAAIAAEDWNALDEILEGQKALWRELLAAARGERLSHSAREAARALAALYEVRRQNHALLERSFSEMRRRLTTAHLGAGAHSAYRRAQAA